MLTTFLEESTIHGLRYLVVAKKAFEKSVWFVAILASLAAACTIVYFNVMNWRNSPIVVTNIEEYSIIGNMPFPTVTLCQARANWVGIVEYLFNEEGPNDEEVRVLDDLHVLQYLFGRKSVRLRFYHEHKWDFDKKWEDVCHSCLSPDLNTNDTMGGSCDLINLLYHMISSREESCWHRRGDKHLKASEAFIVQATNNPSYPVTLAQLALEFERLGGNLTNAYESPEDCSHSTRLTRDVYAYFFDIGGRRDDGSYVLREARGLSGLSLDYTRVQWKESDKPGTTIMNFFDSLDWEGFFGGHDPTEDFWQVVMRKRLARYLELDAEGVSNTTFGEMMLWLDMYSYSERFNFWFSVALDYPDSIPISNHDFCERDFHDPHELSAVCDLPDLSDHPRCEKYCEAARHMASVEDKVTTLFRKSIIDLEESFVSAFPTCGFFMDNNTDQCWSKVTTENGICFALKEGIVSGTGVADPYLILYDKGPFPKVDNSGKSNPLRHKYIITVTPRGQVARSDHHSSRPIDFLPYESLCMLKVRVGRVSTTTDLFRALNVEQRSCLYPNERRLEFFDTYSKANCILQCAWHSAAEMCQCVPWFLHDKFPDFAMCHRYKNQCFRDLVERRYQEQWNPQCTDACLDDCETAVYEINIDTGLCDYDIREEPILFDYAEKRVAEILQMKDELIYDEFMHSKFSYERDRLKAIKIAILEPTTMNIVKTASITLVSMISNIGGTLGLFLGVSLLSGLEIVYWFTKYLISSFDNSPSFAKRGGKLK